MTAERPIGISFHWEGPTEQGVPSDLHQQMEPYFPEELKEYPDIFGPYLVEELQDKMCTPPEFMRCVARAANQYSIDRGWESLASSYYGILAPRLIRALIPDEEIQMTFKTAYYETVHMTWEELTKPLDTPDPQAHPKV